MRNGKRKSNKLLILTLITILAISASSTFSYGDDVTQQDLNNAKQKTAAAKQDLAEKQQKEASIAADISVIEQRISNSKAELSALNKKINKAEAKMDKLTEKFMVLQNDLALQESDLNARLKEMYLTSDTNVFDVILNSENIVDLISNMDMIQRIHKQDVQTVEDITKKQEQVEQKKQEITETHDALVADYDAQKTKTNELLDDQQELITAKANAGQDTAAAQSDYDNAKANQSSIAEDLAKPAPAPVVSAPSSGGGSNNNSGGGNDTPSKPSKKTPALGNGIVADAKALLGIPYKWGGTSPSTGFDCSGLTQYVYARNGIFIPRTSGAQGSSGKRVSISNLEPGDIVWRPGHVGLYVGGGRVIHAPQPGSVVSYTNASGFSHGVRY